MLLGIHHGSNLLHAGALASTRRMGACCTAFILSAKLGCLDITAPSAALPAMRAAYLLAIYIAVKVVAEHVPCQHGSNFRGSLTYSSYSGAVAPAVRVAPGGVALRTT
jgi:hypothetical protein